MHYVEKEPAVAAEEERGDKIRGGGEDRNYVMTDLASYMNIRMLF